METKHLPFRFETTERYSTLQLTPQLSEVDWSDIEQIGAEILARLEGIPSPTLIVDLSQLTYIGSSQVALIVKVWKVVKSRDGQMAVVVTHPLVKDVLKIAGLNNLWDITETPEEARKALGVDSPGSGATSMVGLILGLVGLAGAVGGLVAATYGSITLTPQMMSTVRYVSEGLAAVGGIWSMARGQGTGRTLGILIFLAAVGLITLQVLQQFKVI